MMLDMNTMLATQSLSQSNFDSAARAAAQVKQDAHIDAIAKDFESMFIAEMMKPMFEGLEVDPMFGGGKGEEIFRGLLLQEYGKIMAETGTLGIADSVKRHMIEMQEVADTGSIVLGDKKTEPSLQESEHHDTSL
jgi:peptidoglycan hydrolase FlgJ